MLVISEASEQLQPSASTRDLHASTEAAKLVGCRVYHIPQDFTLCETAENALWHIPIQSVEQLAVWIGYIPTFERYREIYNAALAKKIRLLNNPEEHLRVQEFDGAYPLLKEITPQSIIVTDTSQIEETATRLGFPLFVKGAVQSLKAEGLHACVAYNLEDLQRITKSLFKFNQHSRGRVVVRRFAKLRFTRTSSLGFPLGREYRVFVYSQRVLGLGYYWEGSDDLKGLSSAEQQKVIEIALEAARRLQVPYVGVDIGQTTDREWIVIETGDPQFSGVSQIPLLQLWNKIKEINTA